MKHIETAVLMRLEVALAPPANKEKPKPRVGSEKWWKAQSKSFQKKYLKEHPSSKFNPANKSKSKNKLVKKKPLIPGGKPHTEHQIRQDEKRKVKKDMTRKDAEKKAKEGKKSKILDKKAKKRAIEEKKKRAIQQKKLDAKRAKEVKEFQAMKDRLKELKSKPKKTESERLEEKELLKEKKAKLREREKKKAEKEKEAQRKKADADAKKKAKDEKDATEKERKDEGWDYEGNPDEGKGKYDVDMPDLDENDSEKKKSKIKKLAHKALDWYEESTNKMIGAIKVDLLRRVGIDAATPDPRPRGVKMYDSLNKVADGYKSHIKVLDGKLAEAEKARDQLKAKQKASTNVLERKKFQKIIDEQLTPRFQKILAKRKEYQDKLAETDKHMEGLQDRRDRYSEKQGEAKEKREALREWGIDSRKKGKSRKKSSSPVPKLTRMKK